MVKKIKSNLILIVSIILAILIIGGAMLFSRGNLFSKNRAEIKEEKEYVDNVSIVDGKQIIRIQAKGGFSPEHSIAKAGLPTILRLDTRGTFDCSSIVRIPSLNISRNLPLSGTTDIDLGVQKIAKLYGTCGMGMYPFDIEFN